MQEEGRGFRMGALDYIKNIFKGNETSQYKSWLMDGTPSFIYNFGKDIYLSDFVNNAIDRVASEISKIEIKEKYC